MSAFIVSHAHINALVSAMLDARMFNWDGHNRHARQCRRRRAHCGRGKRTFSPVPLRWPAGGRRKTGSGLISLCLLFRTLRQDCQAMRPRRGRSLTDDRQIFPVGRQKVRLERAKSKSRWPGKLPNSPCSHSKTTPDSNPNARLRQDWKNPRFLEISKNGFVSKLLSVCSLSK